VVEEKFNNSITHAAMQSCESVRAERFQRSATTLGALACDTLVARKEALKREGAGASTQARHRLIAAHNNERSLRELHAHALAIAGEYRLHAPLREQIAQLPDRI
jgi:hypothetical protein